MRAWALYQLPRGLSVSGAYFYGSGNYFASTVSGTPYGKPGTNRLNIGAPITVLASAAERFEGPIVIGTGVVAPRNAPARDAAAQGRPADPAADQTGRQGAARADGEVFNVFNHDNFGSFVTIINNASFGQPRQNLGNAYVPRSGQLGFRFSF